MIVKKLQLVNFQVIKEFTGDFDGNVYFITGDNELGKSTILKAIGAMLTGERDAVLRNGEEKGFAKMIVGDDGEEYEIELRYTKANPRGTLSIKQKTTGVRSDNVSMLQKIFGYTDFDAVEFSRWSDTADGRRKQIEVVKSLMPENVRNRIAEIDTEVTTTKEQRKQANAEVKTYTTIAAQAEKQLQPGDVEKYTTKMDITALMEEQAENAKLIEKAKTVRAAHQQRIEQLAGLPARREEAANIYNSKIAELEQAMQDAKAEYDRMMKQIDADQADWYQRKENCENWLAEYEKNNPETTDTADQLRAAERHNQKVALVEDYNNKRRQADAAKEIANGFQTKLAELAKEREQLVSSAKLPIDGLTFTDDGLQLNGVPFAPGNVSDSQIMEVATKLIIASNPTVKVFRIARGESLGAKRLQTIIDIAKANGFQGFVEEVRRGQDDLIIEEYEEQ